MTDMIERVARALCVSDVTPPDRPVSCLDNTPLWELHKKAARAAIAAMREPTDRMVHVGTMNNLRQDGFFMGEIWKNMIDAALEEK